MAVIFFLGVIFVSMLSDPAQSAKSFCDNICTLDPLEMYDPVCGSDGKTYAHNCAWRKSVCKSKVPVSVVHIGKCKAGGDCLKKIDCHTDKNQICASDGKPYFNECAMRKHACKDKKAKIGVQIGIKCSSCPKCEDDDHHPAVCGSDHKTYKSICHLRAAACIAKTAIIVLKNGPCEVQTSPTHPEKSHEKPDKKPEGGEGLESWFSDQQQEDKGDARWGGRGRGLAIDNDFPRSADEAKSLKDQDLDGEEDERRSGGGYGRGFGRGFEMNRDFGRDDDAKSLKDQDLDGEEDEMRSGGGYGGGFGRSFEMNRDFGRDDDAKSLKDQGIDGEEDERRSYGGFGYGYGRDDDARLLKDEEEDGEHDDPLRDDDN